jgi:hypothetical protein
MTTTENDDDVRTLQDVERIATEVLEKRRSVVGHSGYRRTAAIPSDPCPRRS